LSLVLANRQRTRPLHLPFLRRIVRSLLEEELQLAEFELGIFLVDRAAITQVNERYLRHRGSTDVITFDYGEPSDGKVLVGEILVCVEEAGRQARRYRTDWQSEVVRYIAHGVLHLRDYDDRTESKRRRMKKVEDRLVSNLASKYDLHRLGKKRNVSRVRLSQRAGDSQNRRA
jgi:rRNA maturation RNase YbeY